MFEFYDKIKNLSNEDKAVVHKTLQYSLVLASGLKIGHLSNHQLKLSSGDILPALPLEVANYYNYKFIYTEPKDIKYGHKFITVKSQISEIQALVIAAVSIQLDVLIVPLSLLLAIKESYDRDLFPNVYVFKSTEESKRLGEKIVDLQVFIY